MKSRGDELREMRLARDLSVSEVARMLHLREEFIEAIEDGNVSVHTLTYVKIKQALEAASRPVAQSYPEYPLWYEPDPKLPLEDRLGAMAMGVVDLSGVVLLLTALGALIWQVAM